MDGQMTKEQAFQIIDQATGQLALQRAGHVQVQTALQVIADAMGLNKKTETQEETNGDD